MIRAVLIKHIADDLVASVIAEIHVYIGHADSLGVKETLKEKVKSYGIYIGNADKIRHKATRARASSGAYGDRITMGKINVIPDYQKIVGISHTVNNAKLIIYSVKIGLLVSVIYDASVPNSP